MASGLLLFQFAIFATACCLATVSSLTCLRCSEISHPRFCVVAEECHPGQVCLTETITTTDHVPAYRLGCADSQTAACRNATEYKCAECCSTDLCNANSCNDKGYPQDRGPVCYSCSSRLASEPCDQIDVCHRDEVCYIAERHFLGEKLLERGCAQSQLCGTDPVKIDIGTIIGKRAAVHDTLADNCRACCSTDICNHNCTRSGGWGQWLTWGACSVSCGAGQQTRTRVCHDSPASPLPKQSCIGAMSETRLCSDVCPVDGTWGSWHSWQTCSIWCGTGGFRTRNRTCLYSPGAPKGRDCPGNNTDTGKCDGPVPCPVDGQWGVWHSWQSCSISCGTGGIKSRNRSCLYPPNVPKGNDCPPGNSTETQACDRTSPCPVDGQWGSWHSWQSCSISCGTGGIKSRNRTCLYLHVPNVPRGHDCQGNNTETRACDTMVLCPTDGVWRSWSQWQQCSVTCGGGTSSRSRVCSFTPHTPQGMYCEGSSRDRRVCNEFKCPF